MIDFDLAPGGDRSNERSLSANFGETDMPHPTYIERLNPRQQEAATCVDGPLIVLAGAGSGKTSMVTSRIAYLIDRCRVAPHQILAVTFTNKAAAEMRSRVERALDQAQLESRRAIIGQPEIGTFHAICVRILRRHLDATPFKKPFTIYDDSDQLSLVKTVMKKLDIDTKNFNPKAVQGAINLAKCDATEPEHLEPGKRAVFDKIVKEVYSVYQKDLFQNGALDFGEILCLTYRLLRDNEQVRKFCQNRYQFIHVDEYQDTNRVQYLILALLSQEKHGGHQNICVVGDEDQSIYKWRGADIQNILDFERDFPEASVVKLEQNYRSTKTIIEASSGLISHNTQRKDKRLWTDNDRGSKIFRSLFADERGEADGVIQDIQRLSRSGSRLQDMAIFYRTHAQSRQFEDVFRRERINYQVIGGLRFYDRKEIKDILAYFRVIFNPAESVSIRRVINTPARGIGKTTQDKMDLFVNEGRFPDLWSALVESTSSQHSLLPARTAGKLRGFAEMIQRLQAKVSEVSLSELYHLLLDETGYATQLKKEGTIESMARIENLEEMNNLLIEFEEDLQRRDEKVEPGDVLSRFLEQVTLSASTDVKDNPESVKLMTLHGAKGLEFDYVFMVGLEEGLFPSIRPWEATPPEEIEEERRLCYVGMTRAKRQLYMSHVNARRLRGEFTFQEPARFFSEIPEEFMEMRNHSGSRAPVSGRSDWSADSDFEEFDWIGYQVNHPDYGTGIIRSSEGVGENQKVVIEFDRKIKKKFVLRYLLDLME